jgi:hypothetical protein
MHRTRSAAEDAQVLPMSESENPGDFQKDEIAEWRNQIGTRNYRNRKPCLIESGLMFSEGTNDRTGEVDFGFGYKIRDAEGPWFAFTWELQKRLPPAPDWQTMCRLHAVDVRSPVQGLVQDILRAQRPKVEVKAMR